MISDIDFAYNNIVLDFLEEPFIDIGDAFPDKYITINLKLFDAMPLYKMADTLREQIGLLPMMQTVKHPDDYDDDGWYDIYLDVNDYDDLRVGDHIDVVVSSPCTTDDWNTYEIPLSESVREALYPHLNKMAKRAYGMSLDELFAEAREDFDIPQK